MAIADSRSPAPLTLAPAIGIVAMVAGLLLTGAAGASLLADPGATVRWGLPLATMVARTAAALTIGALTLCALVLVPPSRDGQARDGQARDRRSHDDQPGDGRSPAPRSPDGPDRAAPWRRAARVASISAIVWALATLVIAVLTFARAAGRPLGAQTFGAELAYFLTELPLGRNHLVATIMIATLALLCTAVTTMRAAALCAVAALAALLPMASTGHAAGSASHELAVSSLWMHVGAVSVWAGGLAVLCALPSLLGDDLTGAASRYSRIAGWAFALTGLSGLVNATIRMSTVGDLATGYGTLLVVKVVAFVALGAAGWYHRNRTLARLPERPRTFWRLAFAEVLLMAGVYGVSVALGSSPPPVPQEPVSDPGPVWAHTGHQPPQDPTWGTWFTQWRLDVLFAVVAVVLAGMYVVWVRRLRRRGDSWPVARSVAWLLGCVLFAWVTNGGPAVYGMVLFSAHMIQHMLLVMVVPILFVLGSPVTLALRALPSRGDGSRGPREWLLALVHSRWARFFANPVVAAVNFAGSMIVFYYTPLFSLSLSTHVGHVLMVVHFTLAGYMFAAVLIGRDPGIPHPPYPLRLVMLFATMAFHAFFGVAITQSTTLFAADHFGALGLPWWVDALADQHTGGGITWGIGEIPTLALAVAVAVEWSRDEERTARREDRRADRDEGAELAAYNARLAALARRDEAERD